MVGADFHHPTRSIHRVGPMSHSSLLFDLFLPLPPNSTPSWQRVGGRAQSSPAGASPLCNHGKAVELQETLCVTSEIPEGCHSVPLLRLLCCLPSCILQSSVVVLVNATGLRLDSRRLVLTQRGPPMPLCNIASPIKTCCGCGSETMY